MYIPDFIFRYIIVNDMALQSSLLMSIRPSAWQRYTKKFTKIVYQWKSFTRGTLLDKTV